MPSGLVRLRLFLIVLLLAVAETVAAEGLDFVTIDAAPWAYHDATGKPAGAFVEIVTELERRSGQTIAVSLYPLVRIDWAMESGQKDCAIILWNEHRSRWVMRGEDVYPMPFGVIARKGKRLAAYEDLAPLVISVTRGLSMDARFDADTSLQRDEDKDYLTGLRKIALGRVDAVAGALPTLRHIARQAMLDDHLGAELALSRVPLALQCSKRSPRLSVIETLNTALRAMRIDGSLRRILSGHGYLQ